MRVLQHPRRDGPEPTPGYGGMAGMLAATEMAFLLLRQKLKCEKSTFGPLRCVAQDVAPGTKQEK